MVQPPHCSFITHKTFQRPSQSRKSYLRIKFTSALILVASLSCHNGKTVGKVKGRAKTKGGKRSPDHGSSAGSGYGAAAAPVCTTVYENQCSTVNEQVCKTVTDHQCTTVNKQQYSTVQDRLCSSKFTQEYQSDSQRKCATVTDTIKEQKCSTVNQQFLVKHLGS